MGSRGWLTSQMSSILEDVGPYGLSDCTTHVRSLLGCTEPLPANVLPWSRLVWAMSWKLVRVCCRVPPSWRGWGSGADDSEGMILPGRHHGCQIALPPVVRFLGVGRRCWGTHVVATLANHVASTASTSTCWPSVAIAGETWVSPCGAGVWGLTLSRQL